MRNFTNTVANTTPVAKTVTSTTAMVTETTIQETVKYTISQIINVLEDVTTKFFTIILEDKEEDYPTLVTFNTERYLRKIKSHLDATHIIIFTEDDNPWISIYSENEKICTIPLY